MTSLAQCIVEECARTDLQGKGLCHMHYMRLRRTGTTDKLPPRQQATPEEVKANKNARDARYRAAHPDRVRAQRRAYYRNNESVRKAKAAYHEANKDRRNEYLRQWRADNPDKSVAGRNKRRATLAGVETEFYTVDQVISLYGSTCHLCLEPIDLTAPRHAGSGSGWERGLHIDHHIPISQKGPDTLANVRPSHAICNLRKGKL